MRAAKGDPVVREIKDPQTGRITERQTPTVVLAEQPPASPTSASAKWQEAKGRLLSLKGQIDAELQSLEDVRRMCLQLAQVYHDVAQEEAAITALIARRSTVVADLDRCRANLDDARAKHGRRIGVKVRMRGENGSPSMLLSSAPLILHFAN